METYAAKEMRRQLERGPALGEEFFRLKVTGHGETRWVNIIPEELSAIAEVLDREGK